MVKGTWSGRVAFAVLAFCMAVVGTLPAANTVSAQAAPTGSISGTVTDEDGNPLADVWVQASGYDSWGETQTDVLGEYEIPDLPDGDYLLEFHDSSGYFIGQFYNGAYDWSDAEPVTIGGGQRVTGINVTMVLGGTVSGTVLSEEGEPLAGTFVCAEGPGYRCDSTEADGSYSITGLNPGDYRVWFDGRNGQWQFYDGVDRWDDATIIPVGLSSRVNGIDAVFPNRSGSISGTVTDADGNPLAGIWVNASGYDSWGNALTDSSGTYEIDRLAEGEFWVEFYDDSGLHLAQIYDGAYDWSEAVPVSVSDGQAAIGIDATMDRGGSMSGRVLSDEGDPMFNVYVCMEGPSYRCAFTGDGGTYTVAGLAPGEYLVSFAYYNRGWVYQFYDGVESWEDATVIQVGSAEDVSGIDAVFNAPSTSGDSIWGIVTDQFGNPMSGEVCAQGPLDFYCTDVESDGTYGLEGPPGDYLIGAFADIDGQRVASNFTWIAVGSEGRGHDIVVFLEGSISGAVLDSAGAPVAGASVAVFAPDDSWLPSYVAPTSPTGFYEVANLPRQSYRLLVVPPAGSGLAAQWHSTDGSVAQVPVTHQGVTTVDHELNLLGSASGLVTDPEGDPVSDVEVSLREPGSPWVTATTTTGIDGSYSFPGVQPSSYQVQFKAPEGSSLASVWFDDADHRAQAGVVEVTSGGSTVVDATLRFQRLVTGTVTGPGGVGVEGAVVRAYRPTDGLIPTGRAETAADGSYSLVNLPRGEYRIKVSPLPGSGLLDAWIGGANRSTAMAVVIDDAGQVVIDAELAGA